jgi:hypothetical protein
LFRKRRSAATPHVLAAGHNAQVAADAARRIACVSILVFIDNTMVSSIDIVRRRLHDWLRDGDRHQGSLAAKGNLTIIKLFADGGHGSNQRRVHHQSMLRDHKPYVVPPTQRR